MASASAPPSAEPEPPLTPEQIEYQNAGCKFRRSTNVITSCRASSSPPAGAWAPSPNDVALAVAETPRKGGGCYCASDLTEKVRACASKVGTGHVELTVGRDDDATDCALSIEGYRSSDGRRFLLLSASIRDQATFYGSWSTFELVGAKADYYVGGFNVIDATAFTLPPEDPDASFASERGRREWATLPADLKRWLERSP